MATKPLAMTGTTGPQPSNTPTHTHTHTPTHSHTATQPHSHTATQPHSHTATQPHIHTRMHPHTHARTRTHTHAHARTRTHTHTQAHARTRTRGGGGGGALSSCMRASKFDWTWSLWRASFTRRSMSTHPIWRSFVPQFGTRAWDSHQMFIRLRVVFLDV